MAHHGDLRRRPSVPTPSPGDPRVLHSTGLVGRGERLTVLADDAPHRTRTRLSVHPGRHLMEADRPVLTDRDRHPQDVRRAGIRTTGRQDSDTRGTTWR